MKKIIFIALSTLSVSIGYGQDAFFSQNNNARLTINPAFTGSDSMLVVSANYRFQGWNVNSSYRVFGFSMDKYIRAIRSGIGFNYLYDNQMQGTYVKSRIEFNYAPHFELFKHTLVIQPAIQVSYFQNSIDWSKLTFGDMIDERRGFVYTTNETPGLSKKSGVDLSTGLLLYSKSFFGGVAVHHLNRPDEGLLGVSKLPMKITVHSGVNLKFKKDSTGKFILSPTVLFMKQEDFTMLLFGITAKYKFISLGISYRSEDTFIAALAFQIKNFRVGYSYDYIVSELINNNTRGSHEIGLSGFIRFKKKKYCKIKTLRLI